MAVFLLWRSCETYCMKRWGVELRHFPWQPYENNQAEGQWRQGDAAKPYSLSTCLLRSASQLAVFPFRFLVNSWRASFITLVYFLLLSLSLVLQLQAPWTEYVCTGVNWGQSSGLQTMTLVWNDDLWPQSNSLHWSASMHTRQHRVTAETYQDKETAFKLVCISTLNEIMSQVTEKVFKLSLKWYTLLCIRFHWAIVKKERKEKQKKTQMCEDFTLIKVTGRCNHVWKNTRSLIVLHPFRDFSHQCLQKQIDLRTLTKKAN